MNADELTRYFYLDDDDHAVIGAKRGDHNRLGFAIYMQASLDHLRQQSCEIMEDDEARL